MDTSVIISAATNRAAELKCTQYSDITSTHIFAPKVIEISGSWREKAIEIIDEIGRWIIKATNDSNETLYLFHYQLPYNEVKVSFLNTFPEECELT